MSGLLHRHGWTYREVGYAPTCQANGVILEVTRPDGSTYSTIVDCDVWYDALDLGKHLIALPLQPTFRRVCYLIWSLPPETRAILGV